MPTLIPLVKEEPGAGIVDLAKPPAGIISGGSLVKEEHLFDVPEFSLVACPSVSPFDAHRLRETPPEPSTCCECSRTISSLKEQLAQLQSSLSRYSTEDIDVLRALLARPPPTARPGLEREKATLTTAIDAERAATEVATAELRGLYPKMCALGRSFRALQGATVAASNETAALRAAVAAAATEHERLLAAVTVRVQAAKARAAIAEVAKRHASDGRAARLRALREDLENTKRSAEKAGANLEAQLVALTARMDTSLGRLRASTEAVRAAEARSCALQAAIGRHARVASLVLQVADSAAGAM